MNSADVPAYQDFMKQIIDQGIYIQWYDSATYPNGGVSYQNMFNDANSPWVQDPNKGKISDSIFLNYWFSGNMLQDSADHAKSLALIRSTRYSRVSRPDRRNLVASPATRII